MRTDLIPHLVCPAEIGSQRCGETLELSDTPLPVRSGDSADLHEAVLRCRACQTGYPIISGVAILVPKVRSWLRTHYYYLLAGASQAGGIGPDLTAWLESLDWHVGNRFAYNYYE